MSISELESLRNAIENKPPYCCGTIATSPESLVLFYGKDKEARRLDFTTASEEDLEHLAQTCEAATFGVNKKDVLDETFRKAGKLDTAHFSCNFDPEASKLLQFIRDHLLEGDKADSAIRLERYKLNVYGKDSFFKSHKDTPRSEKMFGSLVLIFPTKHDGGELIFRDHGEEWVFDPAKAVNEQKGPCMGYAAFYSDVNHEVSVVKLGYRVTLTYNLYYGTPNATITNSSNGSSKLKDALESLLEDPSFLSDGGYLGFGLKRSYPISDNTFLRDIKTYLKGSDANILKAAHQLSLRTNLYLWYENSSGEYGACEGVLCDFIPDFGCMALEDEDPLHYLSEQGGTVVGDMDPDMRRSGDSGLLEPSMEVYWVTTLNDSSRVETAYAAYGNEPSLGYVYGNPCLIASVDPARQQGHRVTPKFCLNFSEVGMYD